jgi:hypothetical protein
VARDHHLVNGATVTVTAVDPAGLTVRLANGESCRLPAGFVAGRKPDGSPKLSHSWARTIDGAQGGTWETCHLLGTAALDAYRGYTGQSRSRQPTHTWNTTPLVTLDHGGVVADQRTPDERVVAALARRPDPTMAARSDPWTLDHQLSTRINEHQQVLAAQPLDRTAALRQADRQVLDAEQQVTRVRAMLVGVAEQTSRLGPLTGISRPGRRQRDNLRRQHDKLTASTPGADETFRRAQEQRDALRAEQVAYDRFGEDNQWRHTELRQLHEQLAHHWAGVIVDCARAGDPLAFGIDRLRHARRTLHTDLRAVDAQVPIDRQRELHPARQACAETANRTHRARQVLAAAEQAVTDAEQRRWGRRDPQAITAANHRLERAKDDLDRAVAARRDADDALARVREHQQQRQQALAATTPKRSELTQAVADLDAALDHTRPDRVARLAAQPDAALRNLLGDPPTAPAGRAVWCRYASTVETIRDHHPEPDNNVWHQINHACQSARREIELAGNTQTRNIGAQQRTEIDIGL